MAQFLQRRVDAAKNGRFDVERDDLTFYQRYPAIAEHLCHDRWENGESRITTTFLVFFEEGAFKCCVHDRSQKVSTFVSGRSMQDLLDSVELGLKEDLLVWRPDRERGRKNS